MTVAVRVHLVVSGHHVGDVAMPGQVVLSFADRDAFQAYIDGLDDLYDAVFEEPTK